MITDATRFGLIEGSRQPQTDEERRYLLFMGGARGPRESWPTKWCVCDTCHAEWNAQAFFPSPTGHWVFPYRCPSCRNNQSSPPRKATPSKKAAKSIRPAELDLPI